MQQEPPKEIPPPRAVRLTFSFGPEGVQLVDRQVIDKRLPPQDDLPAELDATTVAAELRSATGAPSYRVLVPHAIPADVEVFNPDGTSHRDPTPPAQGVFTVLVPVDPEAYEVVLLTPERPPTDQSARAGGKPVEYGRFPLRPDEKVGHS